MFVIEFLGIILSILSVFAVGFVIGIRAKLDVRSLSYVAIRVFYPILAFYTFYEKPLTSEHLSIFYFCVLLYFSLFLCVIFYAKITKSSKKRRHAMLLSDLFMNGGNYGVPVVLLSMGHEGYIYALMIMVMMDLFMNPLGIYIAASGGDEGASIKKSLLRTVKMPVIPAIVLGIIMQTFNIRLPELVEDTLVFLSDATIPLIMIVLGVQLSTIKWKKIEFKSLGFTIFLRLIGSPLIAIGIVSLLGLWGTILGTVLVIVAAMPSAANTTIFSLQFDTDPDFVTTNTLLTTLLSVVTLPILLALLL